MTSNEHNAPRRYLLQTGAAALGTGLAGCIGGDDSESSGSGTEETDTDTNPAPEEDQETDYSLPESQHADPVDMATEWMILPDEQGDALQAVALSPSRLSEKFDISFSEEIGANLRYDMFEFSHEDIPQTYVQRATDPWASEYKIDQLPGNVSETSLGHQLKDAGYNFQEEIGNFKIYSDGEEFHAVGEDRHINILRNVSADPSQAYDLMERVIEETNENTYKIPEIIQTGLDKLDVQDSLTLYKNPGAVYMQSHSSYNNQPAMGISSVNFEDGEKHGSWPFENSQDAENGLTMLEAHDGEYMNSFEDVELQGRAITASGGNFDSSEVGSGGSTVFSVPYI